MKPRWAFVFSFLFACGSTVTQDPPNDPTDIPDASADVHEDAQGPGDAGPNDAGTSVIGRPCTKPTDCSSGGEFQCQLSVPDGYCSMWCAKDAECPAGSLCAPMPLSRVSGTCMTACSTSNDCRPGYVCEIVELFPGQPNVPKSSGPVCWEPKDGSP